MLSSVENPALRFTLRCLEILAGAVIYAAGFRFFLYPTQICSGGIAGIAQILNYVTTLPIGMMTLALNIPIFAAAWRGLGWKFLALSLVGTFLASVMIDVLMFIPTDYVPEPLIASIYGGVLPGAGMGLIFRAGGTTGGTDILSHLVRKKRPGTHVGAVNFVLQAFIVVVAAVVFGNYYIMMYAVITIFIEGRTTDAVLYGIDYGKQVLIISERYKELSDVITQKLERGVTQLYGRGAYTGEEKTVLLCAIRKAQISTLRTIIRETDPDAFIIITEARDVLGNGFDDIT